MGYQWLVYMKRQVRGSELLGDPISRKDGGGRRVYMDDPGSLAADDELGISHTTQGGVGVLPSNPRASGGLAVPRLAGGCGQNAGKFRWASSRGLTWRNAEANGHGSWNTQLRSQLRTWRVESRTPRQTDGAVRFLGWRAEEACTLVHALPTIACFLCPDLLSSLGDNSTSMFSSSSSKFSDD